MKFLRQLTALCCAMCVASGVFAQEITNPQDDTDSQETDSLLLDSMLLNVLDLDSLLKSLENYTFTHTDSIVYYANPFFTKLILPQKKVGIRFTPNLDNFHSYIADKNRSPLLRNRSVLTRRVRFRDRTHSASLAKIRSEAYTFLANTKAEVFSAFEWELPDPEQYKYRLIMPTTSDRERVQVSDARTKDLLNQKIQNAPIKLRYWQHSLEAQVQFSQNHVSKNWYKGGTASGTILNTVKGEISYQNYKNIKWTTNGEWKTGVMTVADTTKLRQFNINEDQLKIDSKFELKAVGNWSYSVGGNLTTQFFDKFQSYNSFNLKEKFLTPIRFNLDLGITYGYKNLVSVTIAPVSYKLIYLTDTALVMIKHPQTKADEKIQINPKSFGIETGKNRLNEIGSRLTVEVKKWKPFDEITVNSKFNFYTNFKNVEKTGDKKKDNAAKKMEIDWETTIDFAINRFLSTTLVIHPRYDNTMIFEDEENPRIQFQQSLTFGLRYKF